MSSQKSRQRTTKRYTGPELSELLDQVVSEHGSAAAIESVNRIRTGGIAGFFCTEEFEVLVAPDGAPSSPLFENQTEAAAVRKPTIAASRAAAQATPATPATTPDLPQPPVMPSAPPQRIQTPPAAQPVVPLQPEVPRQPRPAGVPEVQAQPNIQPSVQPNPPNPDEDADSLRRRSLSASARPVATVTATTDTAGATAVSGPAVSVDLSEFDPSVDQIDVREGETAPSTFAGPVASTAQPPLPPTASGDSEARAQALLERRLDLAPRTEPDRFESTTNPGLAVLSDPIASPRSGAAPSTPASKSQTVETSLAARAAAPAPASSALAVQRMAESVPATSALEAVMLLSEEQARTSPFWLELYRAQRELASFMPLDSPFVVVIGDMSQAMMVARRLRGGAIMKHSEVFVLTDRAGIVSEPTWNIIRSGRRLLDVAAQRSGQTSLTSDGVKPTIFIVDVPDEVPNWLFPLQNRLRSAGVSLFHHVVNGHPSGEDLEPLRQGSDFPYAIDLVARVEPVRLLELVDQRHPIASVAGTRLTAEFLVALRRQVNGGY